MKSIVCGGRNLHDRDFIFGKLDDVFFGKTPTIVHGGASGVDTLAGEWAKSRGLDVIVHKANWEEHGNAAGPLRNRTMLIVEKPDLVVAFPGGRGTANMVRQARDAGVKVCKVSPGVPMTPPDDLLNRARAAWRNREDCQSCGGQLPIHRIITRGDGSHSICAGGDVLTLIAALESDRALLRRIVEAWDDYSNASAVDRNSYHVSKAIAEARARVGDK